MPSHAYASPPLEEISASKSPRHAGSHKSRHSDANYTNINTVAGACSRSASAVITYPLDTLKTRLQCGSSFSGMQRDLLGGMGGSLPGTMGAALIYFAVDGLTRAYLSSPDSLLGQRDSSDPIFHCTSASLATLASALIRVPSDVLKHQVQAKVYNSVSSAAQGVIRSQGLRGCYSGFSATLLRDIPEAAIQFALFAKLKERFYRQEGKKSPAQMMLLGGAAGVTSALACTPLDVMKTKLQCGKAKSILGAMSEAMAGGRGIRGLFAGAGPRVLQTGMASAIFFTLFEASKSQLKVQWSQGSQGVSSGSKRVHMPQPSNHLALKAIFPAAHWSSLGSSHHRPLRAHNGFFCTSSSVRWGEDDEDDDDDEIEGVSVSGNSDSCLSTLSSSSSIWDYSTPLEL
jgi:solute carrier family 25 S-adenosylmethionine transporter 26